MFDASNTGDLIFWAGRGLVSSVIQLATFSFPGRGFSHVGILSTDDYGRPLIVESTSFPRPPCVLLGDEVKGVQAHWPEDIIDKTAFHVPLRRELYLHERDRLAWWLNRALGRQYDMRGAVRSGGFLLNFLCSTIHPESDKLLFCSELCAQALMEVGVFQTRNFSRWSPNKLYRHLLWMGVVDKARRIIQ